MSKASTYPRELSQVKAAGPKFDMFILIPILICAYAEIISPLMVYAETGSPVGGMWTQAQREIMAVPPEGHKILFLLWL